MSEFCKGTLRTIRVKDTDSAIRYGWKVILIARAPGPLQKLVDDGRLEHKPELSPSPKLLAKVNKLKKDGSNSDISIFF